jgi:transcriptional regulator with XRE-family HTH domain
MGRNNRPITPLRRAIFEAGLQQKDIAAAVGISTPYLSQIVNGLHCDDAIQARIAEAVGGTISELFPTVQAA